MCSMLVVLCVVHRKSFQMQFVNPSQKESLRRDFSFFCAQKHSRRLLKSTKHARLFSPGRCRAAAGKSLISSRSQLPGRGRNTLENVLPLYAKIAFFVFPWHLFLWLVLSFSSRSGLNEEKKTIFPMFFRDFHWNTDVLIVHWANKFLRVLWFFFIVEKKLRRRPESGVREWKNVFHIENICIHCSMSWMSGISWIHNTLKMHEN